MKNQELKEELKKKNFKGITGINQKGLINHLIGFDEDNRCNPQKGENCQDGYLCSNALNLKDNGTGVCIPDNTVLPSSFQEFTYNGQRIIGSAAAIKALQEKLRTSPPAPHHQHQHLLHHHQHQHLLHHHQHQHLLHHHQHILHQHQHQHLLHHMKKKLM